jgi:hypothetical protein
LRVIIIIVQVRAVKVYVAAAEALRKKERQDETPNLVHARSCTSQPPPIYAVV